MSSDYLKALESLLKAYEQIAESLPRIDRLSTALSDNHDFQKVLAVFYADIIEFHSHAYRFMRRKGMALSFSAEPVLIRSMKPGKSSSTRPGRGSTTSSILFLPA